MWLTLFPVKFCVRLILFSPVNFCHTDLTLAQRSVARKRKCFEKRSTRGKLISSVVLLIERLGESGAQVRTGLP